MVPVGDRAPDLMAPLTTGQVVRPNELRGRKAGRRRGLSVDDHLEQVLTLLAELERRPGAA